MPNRLPSIPALKKQAKHLRSALEDSGQALSHATALEIVAKQHGFRDWNTICARTVEYPSACPFHIDDRVSGEYFGQPFGGRIRGVEALSKGKFFRTYIEFDEAVDVVTFDSFSAFRKRVMCVVDALGRSPYKRSDGVRQLRLTLP